MLGCKQETWNLESSDLLAILSLPSSPVERASIPGGIEGLPLPHSGAMLSA